MAWTSVGELVTSAKLNTVFPAGTSTSWLTWSPTYANFTIGNGTVAARYQHVGKIVVARFRWTFGSTSSVDGSSNTISLPVTTQSTGSGYTASASPIGNTTFFDANITRTFTGDMVWNSTTTTKPFVNQADGTYAFGTSISSTVPFTWTTNDILSFVVVYEAA